MIKNLTFISLFIFTIPILIQYTHFSQFTRIVIIFILFTVFLLFNFRKSIDSVPRITDLNSTELDIFLHEIANQVQQIQAHDFIFWWGHKVSQGPFTSYHMIYRPKNFPVYLSFVKLPRIHSPYFILYTHFSNYKIFITSPPENSFSSAISDDVHIQIFPEASFEELLQKHHAEIKFLKTFYKTRAITFNSTEEEKELTLKFYKRLTREGRIFRYILLRQLFRRKICKLTYRKPIHEQPFFS